MAEETPSSKGPWEKAETLYHAAGSKFLKSVQEATGKSESSVAAMVIPAYRTWQDWDKTRSMYGSKEEPRR